MQYHLRNWIERGEKGDKEYKDFYTRWQLALEPLRIKLKKRVEKASLKDWHAADKYLEKIDEDWKNAAIKTSKGGRPKKTKLILKTGR